MFHPVIETWFARRFGVATPGQAEAWPLIAAGRNVLITAPTGSGKTLAAFLMCLDRLVREALALGADAATPPGTRVVYVSPLKALSNDVRRNLEEPLAEIAAVAAELGTPLPAIRTACRTGDTSMAERREMVKRPPHILVTTPESLYILLTSDSGRRGLRTTDTIIVDEIHAMAADKRGAHLALSVERLETLVGRPLQRIGLSATMRPLEVAARLLVGADRPLPAIVDKSRRRELDLAIEIPRDELGAACTLEQWGEIYERIALFSRQHKSILVFVNTRRLVERVAHNLAARLGEDAIGAHHGSMSRERRVTTEQRLKQGQLKVVVATASLELGIDIGAVDLVCLLGSPRTIATGMQRIGRSGHAVGGTPKGRFFPLTRDQLVECAALVRAAGRGELDGTALRDSPLDILAQQIVAACACEEWDEEALLTTFRHAAPYAALDRDKFFAVVNMLSEGIATSRGRSGALLHRDGVNRKLRARRGARITALTSGGAIPDLASYDVVLDPDGTLIGNVDEDFAIESMAGDIILLGNTSWRVRRVESGRLRVENAAGAPPTVPFWLGEGPARSRELSREVGALREEIGARLGAPTGDAAASRTELLAWCEGECALNRGGAELLVDYIAAGRAALGGTPSQTCVIAERFFDEAGGTQLVIHAPFGGRINRAWGMALRKRFCRSFDFELQAAATDDGILLSLGPQHSFPLEFIFEMLRPEHVTEVLTQAALQAPVFETRWRWNATRALVLRRHNGGKRVPPNLQRMRAQDLLAACFPGQVGCQDNHGGGPIEVPDHPLVEETVRDCLVEAMNADGLRTVLEDLTSGRLRTLTRETPEPSVFAHEILNANPYAFLDDAPLEERRSRAVALRRGLPAEIADTLGQLDPAAVAQVVADAEPAPRDADELHDLLLDLGAWPESEGQQAGLQTLFDALGAAARAVRFTVPMPREEGEMVPASRPFWVAAERQSLAREIWPDGRTEPPVEEPTPLRPPAWSDRASALVEIVRGHMTWSAPVTAAELGARLALPPDDVDGAFISLEGVGTVLRGRFSGHPLDPANPTPRVEWIDRRLLARANRLTVNGLRKQIEPCNASDLLRFLFTWQHLRPGTQLSGRDGVLQIVGQLQGFEAAAGAWESDILAARLSNYDPAWLDELCLSGELSWGRLAVRETPGGNSSRLVPIGLFRRRDRPWLLEPADGPVDADAPAAISDKAIAVQTWLRNAGASFTEDIMAGTRRLRAEVEDALRELVAAGRVTADGFAALRGILATRGRPGGARARFYSRRAGARLGAGRWSLLHPAKALPSASASSPVATGTAGGDDDDRMIALARQYVRRYGVVFRDLLTRETQAPPWRDLVRVYRRLEMRGELRGGRMVGGFVGEQFAAPEALDSLRAIRRKPAAGEIVRVSACDPLNLVGIITPGPRSPAHLGQHVLYRDGVPLPSDGNATPAQMRG